MNAEQLNKKSGDEGGSLTCNYLKLFHSDNLQKRFTEGIHQVESNSFHLTKQFLSAKKIHSEYFLIVRFTLVVMYFCPTMF